MFEQEKTPEYKPGKILRRLYRRVTDNSNCPHLIRHHARIDDLLQNASPKISEFYRGKLMPFLRSGFSPNERPTTYELEEDLSFPSSV